ncbi:zinc finger, CCHC-type containing protein [Tanacetum coccineum]
MDGSISVSSIIDKLPPSWKDFKHTLKHGKDDLSLVQLGSHLRIEESLRAQDSDKGKGKEVTGPSVNMAEEGKNKNNKQNKGKKRDFKEHGSGSGSNKKPKLECWKCGKTGHFKRDCRSGNKKNANAGGSGKGSKDHSQDQGQNLVHVWNRFIKYSVSLISEAFYVQVDAIAWWIDSGATTHVCKDRCWFKTYEPVEDGSVLYMGDDHFAPVHGKGSVVLEFSSGKSITLFNVLYVPKLRKNLISGPVLNKCGYKQVYESDKYILSKCGVFVGFGYYNNGMFMLNLNKVPDDSDSVYMSSSTVVNSSLWHARLGHVHYKRMLEMSKDELIHVIDENPDKCTTCMLTKITRQPFKSITRKSVILELIHSDLCDFHATPSLGNKKYVITFIDDASRFCYVYLLHAKDEALDKFRIYKTEVELQQNDLIKTLRTDRGGEYYDPVFFQSVGIIHETTGLSEGFWGEAMAVVRLPDPKRKTLGEKGIDCIFIGYVEHSKTYRFYVIEPNDFVSINSIIESRDVIFDENCFSSIPRPKDIIPNSDESQRDDHSDDVPSEIPKPYKGKRVRKAKSHGYDFELYLVEGSRDQLGTQYSYCYSIEEDPRTYNEAMQSRDSAFWKEAIEMRLVLLWKIIHGFYLIYPLEGIDYFDTYAPIARITTIRLLLALAVIHNLVIHQMDVKTAFLNGHLEEEVYMKQPKGFVMPGNEHKLEYSRAIGCLMYAMTSTRPDIAYAVGRLSRFTSNHSRQHWQVITRVFKYLKGTMNYGLSYVGYPSVGGAISWASKKQTCITGSTMEYEFVALAAAGKKLEWLRNLIHEIPIWPKPIAPISIRCDSAPTMAKAYSQIFNGKSRHFGVRYSMVRELIMNGVISIEFVQMQHNLADHLMKGLARDLRLEHVYLSSRGARTKRTTYVNMKFCRFKKLGLGFLGQGAEPLAPRLAGGGRGGGAPRWGLGATTPVGFGAVPRPKRHLRIEESLRAQDSDKGKGKEVAGPSTGHFKRDCRSGNKKNANAGGSGKGSKDHSQDQCQNLVPVWNRFIKYYVSLISEAFYVQVDVIAWWIDFGATTHVCKDRCWFKTYEPMEDGSVLYMGDDHFAPVHGKGNVVLKFSSGKSITLFNVLYVPKLRKNLISGHVLNKCGYKQVYESDKCILSKSGVFVGFGYYNNGMFMLNLNKVPNNLDSVYMSSPTVVNSSLWHARLGHVHYKRMLEISKDDLIPAIDENHDKYRGGEYYNHVFFQSVGIIHETTAPYTPQQNSVAERKNRALKEMVNSMLSYSGLSEGFWGEAMLMASYLLNRVPNKRNKTTPYELWYKKLPNLSFLQVWGCRAIVRLPNPKRKTLGEKGIDCILVGYAEHSKAYRFYVIEPNDSVSINSIIESRDTIFDENHISSIHRPKDIIPNLDESQRDDHFDDVPSEIPEPCKGKRVWKAKSYGFDFQLYLVEGSRYQVESQYSYYYSIQEDPRTYNEAMQSQNFSFLKEAIDDEIGSIMENNTWVLSDLPPFSKPLVAHITTIRLLLALAAIHNLVIHQKDVKITFLNGDLEEEVYMKQPKGFVMPGNEHKVCKLVKLLYGLKQAPEEWHQKFDNVVLSNGFLLNQSDNTPMDPIEKIKPNTGKPVDQLEYSRAIDCLMYAMTNTRPDIAYAGTMNYGLSYVGYPSVLDGYSYASWINHVEDSSSNSEWVFLLGGGAILWASKKQTRITSSTMEFEFVALAAAGKEAEWL